MQSVTRSTVIEAPIERVWALLRDFNSHAQWHPAIAHSEIEGRCSATQVGCVRAFALHDGNHLREQLLSLNDHDHVFSYCILDASLPLHRYVATVQLRPVTDGGLCFWQWSSTFEVPMGREAEFAKVVGEGVYEAGFKGMQAWLKEGVHNGRY
jgi:NADPH:quinone reductase